MIIKAPQ